MDMGGEGRWVGSVGHEEVLKMTDLKEVFEDEGSDDEMEGAEDSDEDEEGEGEGVGASMALRESFTRLVLDEGF